MDHLRLRALLDAVADGEIDPADAVRAVQQAPFEDLGDLRLDHHRELRTGEPEVVYAAGKTVEQCVRAVRSLLAGSRGPVLATRATAEQATAVTAAVPDATYDEIGHVVVARRQPADASQGSVAVVAAGTSDLPVATECATVLDAFGVTVDRITDVGVAGLHRLLAVNDRLRAADVVVVCAGMEGALPTAVAALVTAPVIAVPTSVGYGAAFEGMAALLGMLTSCAPGISVVNIDNGFGAALVSRRVLRAAYRATARPPQPDAAPGTDPAPTRPVTSGPETRSDRTTRS